MYCSGRKPLACLGLIFCSAAPLGVIGGACVLVADGTHTPAPATVNLAEVVVVATPGCQALHASAIRHEPADRNRLEPRTAGTNDSRSIPA